MSSSNPVYDSLVISQAQTTAEQALADFLNPAREGGVLTVSPAGAGKTQLVTEGVFAALRRGYRVAVATPTNEQFHSLARRLAELRPADLGHPVTLVPANGKKIPDSVLALPGIRESKAKDANHFPLIVGTLHKLGDAFGRGDLDPVDALVIDESYQADSSQYFAVGGLSRRHFLVGDSGQISPFSTIADPYRWRGLPEDPLQTAAGILCRNHPSTPVHCLPITRRLDTRAACIARHFYPGFHFQAAVLPGVRELSLAPASASTTPGIDASLDLAAHSGWALVELPAGLVLQADPETIETIVLLVRRLVFRNPRVRCERFPSQVLLRPERIAVGVSHNDQKDLLRAAFDACGLPVVVETANKLQGLEFEVVVVWHPLAGLPEPDEFHLDPGRLCVLLTRHRHACIVVGRKGDPEMLDDQIPPPSPAYLDWDPDPILNGWEIHRQVYAGLESCRVGM